MVIQQSLLHVEDQQEPNLNHLVPPPPGDQIAHWEHRATRTPAVPNRAVGRHFA